VREAVHDPDLAPRWRHGLDVLAAADVVHLLGGGYVNRIWPRHIGLVAGAAAAARRSGARAALTGLGLTPVAGDADSLLRDLAGQFDVVEVRDQPSADLLGVAPGVDDVFLALPADGAPTPPDGEASEVMLCLQADLLDMSPGRLAGAVLDLLRAWEVDPERVGFVEANPGADRAVFELLSPSLPGARLRTFPEIWRDGLPAARTWVSTRFHTHLTAAAAGVGGVAIAVSPDFYATKHRSLTDLGSDWTVVEDLANLPPRPAGGGFDPAVVAGARKSKLELAEAVYGQVAAGSAGGDPRPRRQRRRWGLRRA
jgi:hypothetical protein